MCEYILPVFGIIIPVYNVQNYLKQCVNSVLNQTFKSFEIVLVDDGSTDNSSKICDDLKESDCRVKVVHKSNEGLISARRTGLKIVNSKYICFLDSDDYWELNTLEKLYEIIKLYSVDIITFKWKKVNSNGVLINRIDDGVFSESGLVDKKQYFREVVKTSRLNSLCIKCCKYELFDVDHDYSNLYKIQNGEDLIQSLPLIEQASTFYYLDEALYNYRTNPESITNVYQDNQYKTLNILRPLVYQYMEKMHLDSKENIDLFYSVYLGIVWDNIVAVYSGVSDNKKINYILSEIRSYSFVDNASKYLNSANIRFLKRKGLKYFYHNKRYLLMAIVTMFRIKAFFH